MQALKHLGQQLHKIWQRLGIHEKLKLVLSGMVVVVALTTLEFFLNRPKYSLLFGNLIEPVELERVTAELDELKIRCRIGKDGTTIYVPEYQLGKARIQLATKGNRKSASISQETHR